MRHDTWRRYLRFWGNDPARDLDDELRFHLESRYDEYRAAGMDDGLARREADRRFGDFCSVRDACVAIDIQSQRERTVRELLHTGRADTRYALRQLRRNPTLSVVAILCFALGIGANTSIFSVVDAVLFRPLPFPRDDRLVIVGERLPAFGSGNMFAISAPEYIDYRTLDGTVFERSAIFEGSSHVIMTTGEPERVAGVRVSATVFDVLGVRAAHGRTFMSGDDAVGAPAVVVISDVLWRRKFDGDPSALGRTRSEE